MPLSFTGAVTRIIERELPFDQERTVISRVHFGRTICMVTEAMDVLPRAFSSERRTISRASCDMAVPVNRRKRHN